MNDVNSFFSKLKTIFWNLKLFTSWDSAQNSTVYVNTQHKLACNEEHVTKIHRVDPTSVRWRATDVTVKFVTLSRRNSSTMFYGQTEAAVSLQNAQYVQPASQLVPSSPSGCRKLIREAHWNAVTSECEERQMAVGAHTSATVKHDAYPGPEQWPLVLSPAW